MNYIQIKKVLTIILSEPPAAIGMRISSERKLINLFGTNLHNIRKILDDFVKSGILFRQHGNGTFIKKVKTYKRYKDAELYKLAKELAPDVLCVSPSGRKMEKTRLKISLWSDFQETTDFQNLIVKSISNRAKELGHSIIMRPLIKGVREPLEPEELIEKIKKSKHDGYIVIARWAKLFKLASSMALVGESIPTCYLMPCSYYIECEPYITLDTDDAIRRAVRIFSETGYNKIGILQKREHNYSQFTDSTYVFRSEIQRLSLEPFMQDVLSAELSINDVRKAVDYFIKSDVEALYIADDHLLPLANKVFKEKGIIPGQDLAVITVANKGVELPSEYNWSHLEFDLDSFGKTIVDSLLNVLSTAGENMMSFSHKATWYPADTHSLYTK